MRCEYCGTEENTNESNCSSCGAPKKETEQKTIKDVFCGCCGNKKEPVHSGRFYEETGKPIYLYECMNEICPVSSLHVHHYPAQRKLFWIFPMTSDVCSICKRDRNYYYY
jgi:hypothetical protein